MRYEIQTNKIKYVTSGLDFDILKNNLKHSKWLHITKYTEQEYKSKDKKRIERIENAIKQTIQEMTALLEGKK